MNDGIAPADKIYLKYDTDDFKLSGNPLYNLQLKYKITGINAPIIKMLMIN